MSNIKLITDSTAYLDRSFAEKHHIEIIPLTVHFEDTVTPEGFPGEFDDFFQRLANSKAFPTTSQPAVGAYKEAYDRALAAGQEVIVLTISSKLSGTYNSASTAANLVAGSKISVVDTLTAAANLKVLIELALKLIAQGVPRNEVVQALEEGKKHTGIFLTVGTLEYLKRGGRLSNTEAFLGSLLNIKPIIALVEGKLEPVAKVRGRKKAIEKLIEGIPPEAKHIHIAQIDAMEDALEIKLALEKDFKEATVAITELGPVVGSHLGPKALGILWAR